MERQGEPAQGVAVKVLGRAGMEGKMGMDVWEIDGEGVSWSRRI